MAQQYQNEGESCRSQFTDRTARIEYGSCTPEALFVSQHNINPAYTKFMYLGMELAADKSDWNSAMINFKRAYNVAQNKGEHQEAIRGYKGAFLAKYLDNSQKVQGVSPYGGWVYVTGVRSQYD